MDKKKINKRLEKFKFRKPKNRYERGWNDALETFKFISTKEEKVIPNESPR